MTPLRSNDLRLAPLAACLLLLSHAGSAHALIPSPVGGRPGDLDASLRLSLERGKVEPNENEASFQRAQWNMFTLGVGYTHGAIGPLLDVSFRLEATYQDSPAEINERDNGEVDPANCRSGVIPGPGLCQFHPADRGAFISPSIAWNVLHPGNYSLGFFLTGNVPIGIDFSRFVTQRIDFVGGGVTYGVRMRSWLSVEGRLYVGSGTFGGDNPQNGTIAITQLVGFEAERWLLPWKAGIKIGTYFDGDLFGERTDPNYDAAYTAGYPERSDRIRMMRFGLALFPYAQITESLALELGYVQKIFGYDTPATQFFTVGLRGVTQIGSVPDR
jgi:hypothetical protein